MLMGIELVWDFNYVVNDEFLGILCLLWCFGWFFESLIVMDC